VLHICYAWTGVVYLVTTRWPSLRMGGLKQQGAAQVWNLRWSMWRKSMLISQKPRVASSMGVNLSFILRFTVTSMFATSPDRT